MYVRPMNIPGDICRFVTTAPTPALMPHRLLWGIFSCVMVLVWVIIVVGE